MNKFFDVLADYIPALVERGQSIVIGVLVAAGILAVCAVGIIVFAGLHGRNVYKKAQQQNSELFDRREKAHGWDDK